MINIKEIKNKIIWEDFLLGCEEKTFLQSWNWGEFQRLIGNKIWRLGIYENNDLLSVALTVKIRAKRGDFLFLPHGPIIKSKVKSPAKGEARQGRQKSKVLKTLLQELKKIAKEERVDFIRIAPIWEKNKENIEIFKKLNFQEAPIHIHPELTWELKIKPSTEELLMGMRKTTRYLIRKAQKNKEIQIVQTQKLEDLKLFDKLYQETVKRHHFFPFPLDYLKNQLSAFKPDNQISVFLGKYKEEIVASGIFVFWPKKAFYHHGASSSKYSKIPVSYLLQWEAIKEAKKRGCETYNFWGIAPNNKKSHPWAGLTLFKTGFGGEKKEYVKTQDFVLSTKYYLTYFFEKLRKIKRGL